MAAAILLTILLVQLIPLAYLSWRLWHAVKIRHPEMWKRLGSPVGIFMTSAQSRRLREFVSNKEFLELDDSDVWTCGKMIRLLDRMMTVQFWTFTGLVILMAVSAPRNRSP